MLSAIVFWHDDLFRVFIQHISLFLRLQYLLLLLVLFAILFKASELTGAFVRYWLVLAAQQLIN